MDEKRKTCNCGTNNINHHTYINHHKLCIKIRKIIVER